ncbi:hypothetical protein, partial [Mesorhizobium sp. M1E.F.Ca.ET.063.01.1.1]|uniref:hypothetical protein n=1 Tax=Mesorhizobium sp. M1E.F.Ca.ET.063.01.1.1 TaxID=2496750 RepID=UPI001AECFD5B
KNWSAAVPFNPDQTALRRTATQGENCNLCIRFKVLPIYRLDSRCQVGIENWRMKASFSPSLYGEKCPAGQ